MTSAQKPKLLPVSVPWMISPSVPYLRVQLTPGGAPASATFIGFFKCDDMPWQGQFNQKPEVVRSAPVFELRPLSEKAPFRMIRVTFLEGRSVKTHPAIADAEIVREDDYDWSAVESSLKPGETIEQHVENAGPVVDHWDLSQSSNVRGCTLAVVDRREFGPQRRLALLLAAWPR